MGALQGVSGAVPKAQLQEGVQPTSAYAPSPGATTAQILALIAGIV
jgi:hypothetical protein